MQWVGGKLPEIFDDGSFVIFDMFKQKLLPNYPVVPNIFLKNTKNRITVLNGLFFLVSIGFLSELRRLPISHLFVVLRTVEFYDSL